jgi:hypothetical protein
MAKFPYTLKTGNLKKFFQNIPSVGKPDKVTQQYLSSLNYKSSNDRSIIPILKFLKFIDDTGSPTERYTQYRDRSKSKKILGAAIQESYPLLFKQYPDADQKDNSTLQNFFSTHTGLGEKAVKSIVETFKALCHIADIQGGQEIAEEPGQEDVTGGGSESTSFHNISVSLSNGKKAKIILPQDASEDDIERLKKMLDVLKS